MFSSKLPNGEEHLFDEAPPIFPGDAIGAKRPERPQGVPDRHWSIFYYWWAFLRLNGSYLECCRNGGHGYLSELYADFGNVRDGIRRHKYSDPGQPIDEFTEWWCELGYKNFKEGSKIPPEVLTEFPPDVVLEFKSHAVIWVWLENDIDYLMAEIRKVLTPRVQAMRGTNWEDDLPQFRVHGKYKLQALHNSLRLKEAEINHQANGPAKKIKQSMLFDAAGLVLPNTKGLDAIEIEQKKAKYASESLKRANNLIWNVGFGRFPDFSDPIKDEKFVHPQTLRKQLRATRREAGIED